jgi:tungstate transport system ATP-binding protein
MQRAAEHQERSIHDVLPVTAQGLEWSRGGRGLAGVDLEITPGGGPIIVLGPNGAGKSVLLRLLAGLLRPDAGRVLWQGRPPGRDRATAIGFVFQRPVLLRRSVLANIEYALAAGGVAGDERRMRAQRALERAGLAHLAHSPARVLSGGEQQRVSLARALALRPEFLILDEPTANLDPASIAAIESELHRPQGSRTRILMVTQDLGQARRLASEIVFLHNGRIKERTPADRFFNGPQTAEASAFLKGEIVL